MPKATKNNGIRGLRRYNAYIRNVRRTLVKERELRSRILKGLGLTANHHLVRHKQDLAVRVKLLAASDHR